MATGKTVIGMVKENSLINKIKSTRDNGSKILKVDLDIRHTKPAVLTGDNLRTTLDMEMEKWNLKSLMKTTMENGSKTSNRDMVSTTGVMETATQEIGLITK